MNLLLRFLRIVIQAFFREKVSPFKESTVSFRVFFHDLDYNFHMTNSRYHSMSDLARVDSLMRSGLGRFLAKNGYGTVLGSSYIRFRRSLQLFQKVTVRTRLVGFDTKWFYIEHYFESNGQLIASSIIKGIFIKQGKSVKIEQVLKEFLP